MMTRSVWMGLGFGIVLLVGALVYFNLEKTPPVVPALETPEPVVAEPPAAPSVPAPPEILHPVPAGTEAASLPPLEGSDSSFKPALQEALGGKAPLETLLVPREIIRRLVLNIDSLDRDPAPLWLRSVPRVPGLFQAQKDGEEALAITASNAQRYRLLMQAIKAVDVSKSTALYLRWYPLFQKAWSGIRTEGPVQFNDRLVEIIDHLLETPELAEPIPLVRPKVLYLYADPELEESSSGQKALLRLGQSNAAVIKARLREIRAAIATGG
ncbi:MAG: DUF3014 domain-containing protein [Panacagrimonas sp.]